MPHLAGKISRLRRRRAATSPPPARAPRRQRTPLQHDLAWHWTFVVLGLLLAIAGYCWYVSARIIREPINVEFGPSDPKFAAALGPLLGAEFTGGNRIDILQNGDEFFPSMLDAIRHAEHSVTLETYIWSSGRISDEFIDALTERARHGVAVDVLLDGMGTLKFKREDRERLVRAGVQVLKYGREHWYEIKPNINHRTHRKLLIVDGRIGFTGGMCIDDRWAGHAQSPKVWRETEVRVEGPVVREMQGVFATNWLQTSGRILVGEAYFPALHRAGVEIAQCFRSGPGEGAESARTSYLLAIASARRSIDITHAYFVPDDLATQMLVAALHRGVRVRVIVPAINDSRFGRAASRSRWGPLLAAGAEFHLYEPAMLHCKTMVVDDTFVSVGSVNFDNRSFSINDEDALNAIDPSLAREFEHDFARDLAQSRRLTQHDYDQRPAYTKAADWFCGLFRSQL
ncbi:MAG TPA: phospholipase D-like domain-containing protein [Opitutus sp.]|nr:phospholipase D-like domain-containing protein [Opitutus sp.]